MRRGPLDRLATTASLVFIADYSTKQWALRALGRNDQPLGAGWHLTVINNTHLAGGLESGGFDLPVAVMLTAILTVLILRVCRQLAAVDGSAPATLGLLIGAGAIGGVLGSLLCDGGAEVTVVTSNLRIGQALLEHGFRLRGDDAVLVVAPPKITSAGRPARSPAR